MNIIRALRFNRERIGRVLAIDFRSHFFVFDFSRNNRGFAGINISNPAEFSRYINRMLSANNARFGIGRYNENRCIYDHSSLFRRTHRTVHLGIDLWMPARTEVLCPVEGKVHSFRNNAGEGDYGPTIILEHELDGVRFYTLYGHLSLDSIENLRTGQLFHAGDVLGRVGNYPVNGNWPSHLHFQIITDMQGREGDFPGVCSLEDRQEFLELCPDPNLILQLKNPQSL